MAGGGVAVESMLPDLHVEGRGDRRVVAGAECASRDRSDL